MPSLSALSEVSNTADIQPAGEVDSAHLVAPHAETSAADGHDKREPAAGGRRHILAPLDALELRIVRRAAALTRFRRVASLTLFVNLLGNGWIYLPVVVALAMSGLAQRWIMMSAAVLATALAHALYALIKRGVARPRPYETDPDLQPLARALDRYAFPSGHCMTLTAVAIPIVRVVPSLLPFAVGALCVLAWCRLSAAHHYPSDVLAGVGLGAVVALPISMWLLPL